MLSVHSVHVLTILSSASSQGYYTMPLEPLRSVTAARTIIALERAGIVVRVWSSRRMSDAELLAGHGVGRSIGLSLRSRWERSPYLSVAGSALPPVAKRLRSMRPPRW